MEVVSSRFPSSSILFDSTSNSITMINLHCNLTASASVAYRPLANLPSPETPAEAKNLMRLVNVEALKMKGKHMICYSELLQAYETSSSTPAPSCLLPPATSPPTSLPAVTPLPSPPVAASPPPSPPVPDDFLKEETLPRAQDRVVRSSQPGAPISDMIRC